MVTEGTRYGGISRGGRKKEEELFCSELLLIYF